MATQTQHAPLSRLVLRPSSGQTADDGAWWPSSRRLGEQLVGLFSVWPEAKGRIVRVLYSPPDWDDRPRAVAIPGRGRVKTGSFPHDDRQRLVLTVLNGHRYIVAVIPPDTNEELALDLLTRAGA